MLIARQRTLRDGSPLPPLLRRGGEAGRGEARRGERRGGRFFFSRLSTKLFPRNRRNRTAAAKFFPPFSDPLDSPRETIIFRRNFLSLSLSSFQEDRYRNLVIRVIFFFCIIRIVMNARSIESTKSRRQRCVNRCQFFPRAILIFERVMITRRKILSIFSKNSSFFEFKFKWNNLSKSYYIIVSCFVTYDNNNNC